MPSNPSTYQPPSITVNVPAEGSFPPDGYRPPAPSPPAPPSPPLETDDPAQVANAEDDLQPAGVGFWSAGHMAAPYVAWWRTWEWKYKTGRAQMAAAGPDGTPSRVVQLHAPVSGCVVRWSVTRDMLDPLLPDPRPTDPNVVLLEAVVTPADPVPLPDGVHYRFRYDGEYTYAHVSAVAPWDGLPRGANPATTDPKEIFTVPPGLFSQLLG